NHSQQTITVSGDAVNVEQIWRELWKSAQTVAREKERGLRVFVDLSTCPRYYSLGLVAGLIKLGMAPTVTIFYAEAKYPEEQETRPLDRPFSVGQWRAVAIPFLLGTPDPLKKK